MVRIGDPTPPLMSAFDMAEAERIHASCTYPACMTAGLIADLRASQERIKELEEDLKGKMTRQEWYEDYARW